MPVHPAQPNILTDLRLELLTYRILLLSPFEIRSNQQLTTTWRLRLYVCSMFFVNATLRVSFFWQFEHKNAILQHFLYNGQLWMFVDLLDFTFSSLSLVVMLLNGLITNTYQIEFFQELYNFDTLLFATFGIPITRSRTRTGFSLALIVGVLYYFAYCIITLNNMRTTILTSYQYFAYTFSLYFDCISSLSTALYFVNCTQLCRERLASVRMLLRNYNNCSTEQMDVVLQLYVRIRSQILLINSFMGLVVLFKIARDFMLSSSIVYLMCSSLYTANEIEDRFELIFWLVETIIGTILITLTAEMLMTEANECAEIVSSLRTDQVSISQQKLLDNILLWIRHQAPVLNACGFFHIDLRLLFAISGGIITYMIVLLQLQDYDEQSIKTLDFI